MAVSPTELTLEVRPRNRVDVIDVERVISSRHDGFFEDYPRAIFCSHHTTAGYLEQSLCARFNHSPDSLHQFVGAFQRLFPPQADYQHDQLHLRRELTEEQREIEPLNGDSHLTFIGSGLRSCVTYHRPAGKPVYFIDLDGVNGKSTRKRKTTVIGFEREEVVAEVGISIPVSDHPVDSVNIRDPRLGIFELLQDVLKRNGIEKGRIDINLHPEESHTGLTVNEYETLLMKHDLAEVLHNPFRFVAEKGRNMLIDPRAIPSKTLNYAKYDLVQLVNELLDALGMSNSPIERLVDKFLAVPAERFLRMKRGLSLLVSNSENGRPRIVQGTYQSPILVQWNRARHQVRRIDATFVRFE